MAVAKYELQFKKEILSVFKKYWQKLALTKTSNFGDIFELIKI